MDPGQGDELVLELAAIRRAIEEQTKVLEALVAVAEVANLK